MSMYKTAEESDYARKMRERDERRRHDRIAGAAAHAALLGGGSALLDGLANRWNPKAMGRSALIGAVPGAALGYVMGPAEGYVIRRLTGQFDRKREDGK